MDGVSLISSGKLTVCSDIPYQPFEFETDAGDVTGFDFDVVATYVREPRPRRAQLPDDAVRLDPAGADRRQLRHHRVGHDDHRRALRAGELHRPVLRRRPVAAGHEGERADLRDARRPRRPDDRRADRDDRRGLRRRRTSPTAPPSRSSKERRSCSPPSPPVRSRPSCRTTRSTSTDAKQQPDEFVVTETFQTNESYGFAMTKENTELQAALNAALAAAQQLGRVRHALRGVVRHEAELGRPRHGSDGRRVRRAALPMNRRQKARARRLALYAVTLAFLLFIVAGRGLGEDPAVVLRPRDLRRHVPEDHHARRPATPLIFTFFGVHRWPDPRARARPHAAVEHHGPTAGSRSTYIEIFRGIPALITLIFVGYVLPIALGRSRIPGTYGAGAVAL